MSNIKSFEIFLSEMAKIDKTGTKLTVDGKPLKSLPVDSVEPNILMFHNKENNFVYPKGFVMLWFIDDSDLSQEFQNWDNLLMFPHPIAFRNAPITDIWKKNTPIQKHIIGCIRAYISDSQVFIDMMSVRKGYMKNGINNLMIKSLVKEFPDRQIKFSKPTDMGKKFIGKYYGDSKVEGILSKEDMKDLAKRLVNGESLYDYSSSEIEILINKLGVDTKATDNIRSDSQRMEAKKEALIDYLKNNNVNFDEMD